MATAFVYPTEAELRLIAQTLEPRLMENRVAFQLLPIREVDEYFIAWEQEDNWTGLQQLRGLDGQPARVKKTGASRFVYEPGVYGEFIHLSERELTTATRQYGTWDGRVDLSQTITRGQLRLQMRELDRIEYIIWTLLATGTFSVATPTGGVVHTDTYTAQTYNATTWATAASATPIADLRAVQLKSRGLSVNFGAGASVYINRVTSNAILANTNAADLGGALSVTVNNIVPTLRSLNDVNAYLAGQDLPQFKVYDQGYLDDTGTFQVYIPNGVAIVVGQRPAGQVIGEYLKCRNASNPGMAAGSYTTVVDTLGQAPPRTVEIHRGHNGGPTLSFPSAVCIMDVS